MKMVVAPAAAVLSAGLAQVVLAEPPGKERGKELAALEQKMLGAWKGRVGCDGQLGDYYFLRDRLREDSAWRDNPSELFTRQSATCASWIEGTAQSALWQGRTSCPRSRLPESLAKPSPQGNAI